MQAMKAANQHFDHVPNAQTATEAFCVSGVKSWETLVGRPAETDIWILQELFLSHMQQRSTHRKSTTLAALGHARLSYRQMAIYGPHLEPH